MSPAFVATFTLLSGLCWTGVYIELIRRGLRDKTCGMPFFALAFNIAWEFIYAFLLDQGVPLQRVVNVIWFVLDLAVLYTYFKYGRQEFPGAYVRFFVPWSIASILIAFLVLYFAGTEFSDARGGSYSAFAQNLMMSVLFIAMLARRNNVQGQSLYIAFLKWIGTLAPTLLVWLSTGSRLILFLGIGCSFYDILYIVLLYHKFGELGLNPFTRRALKAQAQPER